MDTTIEVGDECALCDLPAVTIGWVHNDAIPSSHRAPLCEDCAADALYEGEPA